MTALIPFDFENNVVRTVMIDGRPCFVGVDVCRAVEIAKPSNAMSRLDDDERVPVLVDTLGGRQTMIAVTESGPFCPDPDQPKSRSQTVPQVGDIRGFACPVARWHLQPAGCGWQ